MGLSVAISGGIILTVFVLILLTLPGLADKMFSIGDVTTQVTQHEQEISKTEIKTENILTQVGSPRVNFTLSNQGSTTLWDFNNFNVLIEYTGAISGKRTEQLSYNGECLGAAPPAGQWCIQSISNDVADPKLLNFGEIANIRTSVNENLASLTAIVAVATDNGVTFKTSGPSSTSSSIPKPPKKWGALYPTSAAASLEGLMVGCTISAVASYVYDVTDNSNAILSTTAIADASNGGISCVAANRNSFRGDQNAYMYAKWEENKITTNRIFIGFTSSGTILPNNADTILDALSGVGLCIRTTDTVYQFCSNNGAGATAYASLTTTEDAGGVHYFEVYTINEGVTWCGKLDGGTEVCSSTVADIPAPTTRMFAMSSGETDGGVTSILWTQYQMYVQSDK